MKIRNVFMLMAAFALASCSKSEIDEPTVNGSDEIVVSSTVLVSSANSRAPYEGTISATNKLKALILGRITLSNYNNPHSHGTMEFTSATDVDYNKPMLGGVSSYPGSNVVYLTGLHPYMGWDLTTTPGEASLTFTGKEDVMFASEQMNTKGAVGNPALAFDHELTLMKFFFYGNADAKTANTTIKSVKLKAVNGEKFHNTVKIDLNASPQTIGFTGTKVDGLPCYDKGSDVIAFSKAAYKIEDTKPNPATDDEQAYIIAPPVIATDPVGGPSYEYTFEVGYEAGALHKDLEVKVDLKDLTGVAAYASDTKGKAFNITFQFIGGQIQATASVTDWDYVGNIEMEI